MNRLLYLKRGTLLALFSIFFVYHFFSIRNHSNIQLIGRALQINRVPQEAPNYLKNEVTAQITDKFKGSDLILTL